MKQDYKSGDGPAPSSPQAEQRILQALEAQTQQPKKRNWRVGAALAAAAVLMTGSALP